jgi:uncharacterized membrane protein YhaH (DUF805 family)
MTYYPPGQQPATGYGGGPVPLQAPLYGASVSQAFTRFWKKYATFTGRASRSEFWWWALINFLITSVLSSIGVAIAGGDTSAAAMMSGSRNALSGLWGLVTLIPGLALGVRRLHDTNRSGWWLLIVLIPVIGAIVLIIFAASQSHPAGSRYDVPYSP